MTTSIVKEGRFPNVQYNRVVNYVPMYLTQPYPGSGLNDPGYEFNQRVYVVERGTLTSTIVAGVNSPRYTGQIVLSSHLSDTKLPEEKTTNV